MRTHGRPVFGFPSPTCWVPFVVVVVFVTASWPGTGSVSDSRTRGSLRLRFTGRGSVVRGGGLARCDHEVNLSVGTRPSGPYGRTGGWCC